MRNIASTNAGVPIGRRLATAREHFGLSQKEFAAELGVSLRAYQGYERDEREVSATLLRALYSVFRISPVWLLVGDGEMLHAGGEIDPSLAEAIADEFGEAVDQARKRDLTLFPSWPLLGYRLALIYNRVIRRARPGEKGGGLIAEEVRFLRDIAIQNALAGTTEKVHPEEVRHLKKIGASVDEVFGSNQAARPKIAKLTRRKK